MNRRFVEKSDAALLHILTLTASEATNYSAKICEASASLVVCFEYMPIQAFAGSCPLGYSA